MVMKKALHIAKANIRKHKSAVVSLFLILTVVSLLSTVGLSVALGIMQDYEDGIDRLNGLHSIFIMTKELYKPAYEDILKNDPRVTQYDIGEAIYVQQIKVNYGGDIEPQLIILNAEAGLKISAPPILEEDNTIPRARAVYLPRYAQQSLGFTTGGPLMITYRNKPLELTVAGFFEASEYGMPNGLALKLFVADECFQELKRQIGSSVWISARFSDPRLSTAFNKDFRAQMDVEIFTFEKDAMVADFGMTADNSITPIMIISAIILVFSLIIVLISLAVTRFRVTSGIEDALHAIGVLKAGGYTSGQIAAGYLTEYGLVSLPAALLGLALSLPVFPLLRQVLGAISGTTWTLGANIPAGLTAALLIAALTLLMVLHSCRRLHKMPPVEALRGGSAANSFRRNHFPLHKGAGSAQLKLGLKNSMAYFKRYITSGLILTGATFAMIIIAAIYQNFVLDNSALIRMVGIETSDVVLTVARHSDADALAAELELLPQVRKTSMLDMTGFQVDGVDVMGFCSSDYTRMEAMAAYEGRLPLYDNEVAFPSLLAGQLGKTIGDRVKIKAAGFTQEYILCGYFSCASFGGQVAMLSLNGYQRLDPYYRRGSINVYLQPGVTFGEFEALLKENYGVVNVYRQEENGRYAAAKARAEEKIANYLEYYGIDSVEYAVIYNGEIILSGSSGLYQIEKIMDYNEWVGAQIDVYGSVTGLLTQVVSLISLGIIALILSMTVRQIVQKRRRELGIMKSGGYTARQLARQLTVSFLPFSLCGVTLGCLGGAFAVNPALTVMFTSSGVHNANVHIYPPAAAAIGLLTLLFTLAVTNILARRIKHITVYELLSE
jgi:putative ABC transport system permease protein